MKIFNTLTREKQEFVPITPGEAKIYACGPTVYNYIHIGNARPLCVFDVLRRYLEWRGMKVNFVQNFTDIDDKLINKANQEGITVREVAERYIKEFWTDAKGLNVREATVHPRATENIDEIIKIISTLVEKGYAYPSGGDVYFRAEKFSQYGKLSHQPLDELKEGASERGASSEQKESPMDFTLWKAAKEGEPFWESPWGKGRPGWHIECSCISMKNLGEYLDIHCGGVDNIFPHHTNEIAQSEAYLGHKWCNYWYHVQHLNDERGKMSKSNGEFLTLSLIEEKGYKPLAYRFFCLQSHYRKPLVFSYETLGNAQAAYDKLIKRITALKDDGEADKAVVEAYREKFIEAVGSDINTAQGLTVLYDMLKDNISDSTKRAVAEDFDKVLALGLANAKAEENESSEDDAWILALIEERKNAKKEKNYARADEIRNELSSKGITLTDTPDGTKYSRS